MGSADVAAGASPDHAISASSVPSGVDAGCAAVKFGLIGYCAPIALPVLVAILSTFSCTENAAHG